jgi:hypothetical protein
MTVRPRLLVRLSGLVPTIVVAVLSVYRPPFLANLESSVYDTLLRAAQVHPPDSRIVIVDVDERSLSAIGQWPWRRDVIGALIARLRDLGASTVALDIIFAESDLAFRKYYVRPAGVDPGKNFTRSGSRWATILVPCRDVVLCCLARFAAYCMTSSRSPG